VPGFTVPVTMIAECLRTNCNDLRDKEKEKLDVSNRINLRFSQQTCEQKGDRWQIKWDEIPTSQRTVAIHSLYLNIIDQ
jgi:hypothetical protein